MNSAATEEPAKKRVRINEDNNTVSSTAQPIYSSTNYAILATDPTLPPAIKAITNYYIDKYLPLSKRKYAKENAMQKLHDPSYIPKSARLHFTVGVSDKASASDDYEALAASVKSTNDTYESLQKDIIFKAAQLELELLVSEKQKIFCEALYKLASIFYLANNNASDVNEALVHNIVLHIITYNCNIADHAFAGENLRNFRLFYYEMFPEAQIADEKRNDDYSANDDVLTQLANDSSIAQYFQPTPASTTTTAVSTDTTIASTASLPSSNNTNDTNEAAIDVDAPMTVATLTTVATPTTVATTNNDEDVDQEAHYNYDDDYDKTNNNNNNDENNNGNNNDEAMIIDNPNILIRNDIAQLSALLKKSFVVPWDKHLLDVETRQINANLTKYATSRIKSKATDKAAAIVAIRIIIMQIPHNNNNNKNNNDQ